jgi:hypothetical protein
MQAQREVSVKLILENASFENTNISFLVCRFVKHFFLKLIWRWQNIRAIMMRRIFLLRGGYFA